jgi:hypothetical protein
MMVPLEEFGAAWRRARPDDPPVDLTLAPRTPAGSRSELPHRFAPGGRPVPTPLSSRRSVRGWAALGLRAIMGKGKHRRLRRRARLAPRRPALVAWVDLRTRITHLLTPDAAAAGRAGGGRYLAVCGADVIPASITDPGNGYCQSCYTASIPQQRTWR